MATSQYTSMAATTILNCFSKWASPSISSVIRGAVADMIEKLRVGQRVVVKPKAPSQLDKVEILTQLLLEEMQAKEYEQTIWKNVRRPGVIKTMLRSRFEFGRYWTILLCSSFTKRKRKSAFHTENIRCLETKTELEPKGGSQAMHDSAPFGQKNLQSQRKIQY